MSIVIPARRCSLLERVVLYIYAKALPQSGRTASDGSRCGGGITFHRRSARMGEREARLHFKRDVRTVRGAATLLGCRWQIVPSHRQLAHPP